MIVEMSNKVVNHLAQKYDNVKEGVTSIMGGKVLEYEAKQILNEGKKEGRIEGRIERLQSLSIVRNTSSYGVFTTKPFAINASPI